MKIQLDSAKKTVSLLEDCSVQELFNLLMRWFPEDWENWTFTKNVAPVTEKVIVEREMWQNPYWNPFTPYYYASPGLDTGTPIENPYQITSSSITLNLS